MVGKDRRAVRRKSSAGPPGAPYQLIMKSPLQTWKTGILPVMADRPPGLSKRSQILQQAGNLPSETIWKILCP